MTALSTHDRLAHLAAQQKRIRDNETKAGKRRRPAPVRVSHAEHWARKMDRIDAMAGNIGWSD